jgi:SAM-dependent methyltransferase
MHTFTSEATGPRPVAVNCLASLARELAEVAMEYPPVVRDSQLQDVNRIAYHVGLVRRYGGSGGRICDVGGGGELFAPGCAALGYDTTSVDDFRDEMNFSIGKARLAPHSKYGVKIVSCDVHAEPPQFPENSFDVVTAFDCIKHWQGSPRRLFQALKQALTPAGIFIISATKRNGLRKQLRRLLGRERRSAVQGWYDPDVLPIDAGQPTLSDLRYMCNDLDMDVIAVAGRNWLRRYPLLARLTDPILRIQPGLASDLYVVARKRSARQGNPQLDESM